MTTERARRVEPRTPKGFGALSILTPQIREPPGHHSLSLSGHAADRTVHVFGAATGVASALTKEEGARQKLGWCCHWVFFWFLRVREVDPCMSMHWGDVSSRGSRPSTLSRQGGAPMFNLVAIDRDDFSAPFVSSGPVYWLTQPQIFSKSYDTRRSRGCEPRRAHGERAAAP